MQGARARTSEVLKYFISEFKSIEVSEGLRYIRTSEYSDLYILDRCETKVPIKQGVGLARKLGMDLAIYLNHLQFEKNAHNAQWIHSCDADVELPANYFDIDPPHEGESVALYEYEHRAEEGFGQAMALYEFSLRYYVQQLSLAGSPYAFQTIGSLIAVTPHAYVQVRGMPKRSGAEDFYFLNKLAKVGKVKSLNSPVLMIKGRPSERVPFGTGPAISKIEQMSSPELDYKFYYPRIFLLLKHLISLVSSPEHCIASYEVFIESLVSTMEQNDANNVAAALTELKFEKQFRHLANKKDSESFIKAFHTWFDAFVTLRFIHIMRDKAYPSISIKELEEIGINIEHYSKSSNLGI